MRKPDKCVHYNGTVNECCEAGVNYRQLAGPPESSYGRRLPCHPHLGGDPAGNVECPKRKLPTPEEVADDEAQMNARFERMGKARAAIVAALGGPWHKTKNRTGGGGRTKCPNCEAGELAYRRAAYNGHIHARCSTPGCCSWME